ncbi:MAG: hypothetical protein PCFJNLEI_01382 [Verrucomicrobiae bacterium]|nr:hypothetical protein [Verrucomicrobiae bacterium]
MPGGKTRGLNQLLRYFPAEPSMLVSPFLGGGSLELALAARGWHIHGYDAFEPLVDFWQEALEDPVVLAEAVERYLPLDRDTFRRLQRTRLESRCARAAAYFVINRSSFSGSTMSGGMSPSHPRFDSNAIDRLRRFRAPNLTVELADFRESIAAHPKTLLYCDPPYPDARSLYGVNGDKHDGFDHQALCDILRSRDKWLLSYSDCPLVRWWYNDFTIIPLSWSYGMSIKRGRELLILSDDVAEDFRGRRGKELP